MLRQVYRLFIWEGKVIRESKPWASSLTKMRTRAPLWYVGNVHRVPHHTDSALDGDSRFLPVCCTFGEYLRSRHVCVCTHMPLVDGRSVGRAARIGEDTPLTLLYQKQMGTQ